MSLIAIAMTVPTTKLNASQTASTSVSGACSSGFIADITHDDGIVVATTSPMLGHRHRFFFGAADSQVPGALYGFSSMPLF
jgi:hypothetical protein